MPDQQVVLITLIVYKVVLIVIRFWAQRRISAEQDFFLAGRQLAPWVAAIASRCISDPNYWQRCCLPSCPQLTASSW